MHKMLLDRIPFATDIKTLLLLHPCPTLYSSNWFASPVYSRDWACPCPWGGVGRHQTVQSSQGHYCAPLRPPSGLGRGNRRPNMKANNQWT